MGKTFSTQKIRENQQIKRTLCEGWKIKSWSRIRKFKKIKKLRKKKERRKNTKIRSRTGLDENSENVHHVCGVVMRTFAVEPSSTINLGVMISLAFMEILLFCIFNKYVNFDK